IAPVVASKLPSNATDIVVGNGFTCALASGALSCVGEILPGVPAQQILGVPTDIRFVAAGGVTTCVIRESGAVLCWGGNFGGVLGRGTFDYRAVPNKFVEGLNARGAMTLIVSNASPRIGESITANATVPGPSVTGSVQFDVDGETIPGCASVAVVSGVATCTATLSKAGPQQLRARYAGSATLPSLVAARAIVVTGNVASTVELLIPKLIARGESTFVLIRTTGDATAIPTGEVAVSAGDKTCVAQLDATGQGWCTFTFDTRRVDQTASADYRGDARFRAATASQIFHVVAQMDINADGQVDLSDALMAIRHSAGMVGAALLVPSAPAATRVDENDVRARLDTMRYRGLDIDLDGEVSLTTDLLIFVRYLSGLRGSDLVSGALGRFALRRNPQEIEAQLRFLID
ncbi:MAG: hypothetical protein EAZ24_11985, partial [Burkholderiales bacterium]